MMLELSLKLKIEILVFSADENALTAPPAAIAPYYPKIVFRLEDVI